jgi:hypothetical protein
MKLQIIRKEQEGIGGFEIVKMESPNSLELSHIIDNSCEVILASDIVDSFNNSILPKLCQVLVSKLRLNGQLIIGGTDVRFFAKYVSNGLLTPNEACDLVCSAYSMSTSDMVREQLEKFNLKVISIHMDGLHYEVKAVRS